MNHNSVRAWCQITWASTLNTVASAKRSYRLHLHPTPIGKRLYVALALHRALKIKVVDAKYLTRFGGWTRETLLHADQLIELARRLDRLAGVPIAVVR